MGVLIGLMFGVGCFLVLRSRTPRSEPAAGGSVGWRERTQDALIQAGIQGVSPSQLIGASIGFAFVVFVVMLGVSRVPVIAIAFAVFAAATPTAVVRGRRRKRSVELREVWPEAVDNLASAIRAGLSLPEALAALGVRGPEVLRPAFDDFAADYRATGRFGECLDRLKAALADPVGDRVVESLRLAREVGGNDLGRLLRTLSSFLRDEARTRAELETRQGWTVNAARLALAAPWALLFLLSTRPAAVEAYRSTAGAFVLLGGGVVSVIAYRVMLRIAVLPTEQRVLR